jgi:hypothetical protein
MNLSRNRGTKEAAQSGKAGRRLQRRPANYSGRGNAPVPAGKSVVKADADGGKFRRFNPEGLRFFRQFADFPFV